MMLAFWRSASVALSTFREGFRNRAFLGMALGGLAMILASLVLSEMVVFDQRRRIVQDFGLFFISFSGVIISIVVGVLLIYSDMEKKTIYVLLTKPIRRHEFLLGRYLGLLMVLLCMFVVMSIAWLAVMWIRDVSFHLAFLQALILIFFELAIVACVAMLFSTFSSPVLSGIFTFGVYVIGRQMEFIRYLSSRVSSDQVRQFLRWSSEVFPDLSIFDINKYLLLDVEVSWTYIGQSVLYALGYIVILYAVSTVIFARKEFV